MENINPLPNPAPINPINSNPQPAPPKNNSVLVLIIILLAVAVFGILALNYFSNWKCAEGKWIRYGFPLSAKPKGACETPIPKKVQDNYKKEEVQISELDNPEVSGLDITSIKINQVIKNPLIITGRARGTWYFEGSFPIKVLDGKGNMIAESYASAQGEWMTEDWVPFMAEIKFSNPDTPGGFLLFAKDNPSGMPEADYSVSVPVKFEQSQAQNEQASIPVSEKCGHDPMNDPILGDCGEDCNTENWKVFKNSKYGYSFRYPANYKLNNQCKNDSCVSVEQDGDSVYISGEHMLGDWPIIYVRHLGNDHYNPPVNTDIPGWIQEKFSWTEKCFPGTANIYFTLKNAKMIGGWNIYFPTSPQAHSRREIFYERNGKIFQIEMIDVDSDQARQFYNIWLSTFHPDGEN